MQAMRIRFLPLILCVVASVLCVSCGQEKMQQKDELAGTWKGHVAGQEEAEVTVKVWEGRMEVSGDLTVEGPYEKDENVDPKQFVLVIEKSPDPDERGKKVHAIYRIENGQLTVAFNLPGIDEPPKSFTVGVRTGVIVLKKE